MSSISSNWKHLPTTKTSQKALLKHFCHNIKVTRKVKDFQKLSNKEIYFTIQSNSTKYNKPFKFILWPNLLEEYHTLSPDICGKCFTDWFKKMLWWIAIYVLSCITYSLFSFLKLCNTQNGKLNKYSVSQM